MHNLLIIILAIFFYSHNCMSFDTDIREIRNPSNPDSITYLSPKMLLRLEVPEIISLNMQSRCSIPEKSITFYMDFSYVNSSLPYVEKIFIFVDGEMSSYSPIFGNDRFTKISGFPCENFSICVTDSLLQKMCASKNVSIRFDGTERDPEVDLTKRVLHNISIYIYDVKSKL